MDNDMREWNPLWMEVVEEGMGEYSDTVHKMIMASINWVEGHPELAKLEWKEKNKRYIMQKMGVSDDIDEDDVMLMGDWFTFFQPNKETEEWFMVMVDACDGIPTINMMEKAINCGVLFKREGWDYFNAFMSGFPTGHVH